MDKELQMARAEAGRWPVLLAGPSAGRVKQYRVRGAEGQEAAATITGGQSSAPTHASAQSKGHAAAASRVGEGSRGKEHRIYNTPGWPVGGPEGADTAPGRSAAKLGLEWFDSKCSRAPTAPHAHWMVEAFRVAGGGIFLCKYCHRAKWLPNSYGNAELFTALARKLGIGQAYLLMLDSHPSARAALEMLKDLCKLDGAEDTQKFGAVLLAARLRYEDPTAPDERQYRWEESAHILRAAREQDKQQEDYDGQEEQEQ